MKVILYTADVGGHDEERPWVDQEGPHKVEVRRFKLPSRSRLYGRIETSSDRLAARWYKCHPDVLFPDHDASIWVDACLEITSPTFVAEAVDQLFGPESRRLSVPTLSYLAFRHPDRTKVAQEVVAADTLAKYADNRHREMVRHFEEVVDPNPLRDLWAMTTLVRTPGLAARRLDHVVWSETLIWSYGDSVALDQLILPYAQDIAWTTVHELKPPSGDLWGNPWFVRHGHRRES